MFSVDKSQEVVVTAYIAKLAAYHSQQDFQFEHLLLVRSRAVGFDQRYVFD